MKRILFILQHTLGDCVIGSTLVAELKRRDPDCEITWAIHPEYVEIADRNPNIKGLVISKESDVVLQEIANERYDEILIPAQVTQTDTAWHQREKYKHGHLVDFYARRCGIEITERETFTHESVEDHRKAIEVIGEDKENGTIVIVHTQSRVPSKDWNQFGELVELLKEYDDLRTVQIGGPEDTWSGADIDMRGKLTYSQIAALCGRADLFVGVDSGLAYIADSVKCESIIIMGMSTQGTSGPISGRPTFIEPKRPEEPTDERLDGCAWPCHSNCAYNKPCIQSITLEEVMKHVEEKIGEAGEQTRSEEAGDVPGTEEDRDSDRADGGDGVPYVDDHAPGGACCDEGD